MKYKITTFGLSLLLLTSPLLAKDGLIKARGMNGQLITALPNQVIVRYKRGRSNQVRSRAFKSSSVSYLRRNEALDVELLPLPAGETVDSFVKKLQDDPDVEYAEPNMYVHAVDTYLDTDPAFLNGSQYYLGSNYLNMPQAWGIARGSSPVIVADLDTGADYTHPDLSSQIWLSSSTTIGIDWNGDGFYDPNNPCEVIVGGVSVAEGPDQAPSNDPMDDNSHRCDDFGNLVASNEFHGTRTAGIIAAAHNSQYIAGVAPGCQIMAVKVLTSVGGGSGESVFEGLMWAVDHGASVINMSLGSESPDNTMAAGVTYALQHNVIVVAAAGNTQGLETSCPINYPAALQGVLAVGSIGAGKTISFFSCLIGQKSDMVVAAGENITSTIKFSVSPSIDLGNGTSFASPQVAGLAALLRSIKPTISYIDALYYIEHTAVDLGPLGVDSTYGYGMVNAYNALNAVKFGASLPTDFGSPGKTYTSPNPFVAPTSTPMEFHWPSSLGNSSEIPNMDITIMNITGETIKKLSHTSQWDGRNEDGNYVASGLYFYYLKTSQGNIKGKFTVIK